MTSTCAIACETLLREHRIAIPIYQKAIDALPPSSKRRQLERIANAHGKSAADLRKMLKKLGTAPVPDNAAAIAPDDSSPIHSDPSGMLALLQREESALERCEEILHIPGLGKEAVQCIQDTVIPRFQKNIAVLERLQESVLQELPVG